MNILEEAIIYATIMHQGKTRKMGDIPYILHPLEVAQTISSMTDDLEIIAAGVLHDIVEDTDGSLEEIKLRFGERVAAIVDSETEPEGVLTNPVETWHYRKEESLKTLKNSTDIGVKMLWLGDKLSNIRSLAALYSEQGESLWQNLHQKDPNQQLWYYRTVAETLELDLNRTGAYKEFIKHLNFIWPGTYATEKTRYKKYREYKVDGCPVVGKGAKGTVYRYDDELCIKVFNSNNTYKDIEREQELAKKAFVAGIPTAISFGIVTVGDCYGSMFELLDSDSISGLIAKSPSRAPYYANLMADLAKNIHSTQGSEIGVPDFMPTVHKWIDKGLGYEDKAMADKLNAMVDALPVNGTMIHGDFHTGNIMLQGSEPILIDMDGLSVAHPIVELSGIYMFYVGFGELDRSVIENFMGFSVETARVFYDQFVRRYLDTEDPAAVQELVDRSALICYARLVYRLHKKGTELNEADAKARDYYMEKIRNLMEHVQTLG